MDHQAVLNNGYELTRCPVAGCLVEMAGRLEEINGQLFYQVPSAADREEQRRSLATRRENILSSAVLALPLEFLSRIQLF